MKNIAKYLIIFILCSNQVLAKQILPETIQKNTITVEARKTGELGKNYFYCQSGSKCSTEQIVKEYYKNSGYIIMRAEYSFWKGMFVLTFLDEFYPHTLKSKSENTFFDMPLSNVSEEDINLKCKYMRKTNLQNFINNQIGKHEQGSYIRWLDEWEIEGYKNPVEYFKSPVVQEFLARIDNKTFYKIIGQILKNNGHNPLGTPDYIIWNNNEIIFVEVKRKNEKLSEEQIEWGEFLVKNKIPYKVIRVIDL